MAGHDTYGHRAPHRAAHGIAGGRWGWRAFAGQLGVLSHPLVPLGVIFIAVPGALALANLVAALPGGQPPAPNPPPS